MTSIVEAQLILCPSRVPAKCRAARGDPWRLKRQPCIRGTQCKQGWHRGRSGMGQPRRAGFLDHALAHKAFLGREEASSTPGQTDQAPCPSIRGLPGPWAWGSPPPHNAEPGDSVFQSCLRISGSVSHTRTTKAAITLASTAPGSRTTKPSFSAVTITTQFSNTAATRPSFRR